MPRLVKTKPKYKCDFCRYKATEQTVIRHERICWNNPDRFCDFCQNEGWIDNQECYYCKQRIVWDERDQKKKDLLDAIHGLKFIMRDTA